MMGTMLVSPYSRLGPQDASLGPQAKLRMNRDHFDTLCDGLALIYHEARNVRHLIRKGFIDGDRWRYLVSLPTNRDDAWRKFTPLRRQALASQSVDGALDLFENRFHVSLSQLQVMFSNQNWRHARLYGGNAWARIVGLAASLAEGMKGAEAPVDEIAREIQSARHNTGTLSEKLARLERAVMDSEQASTEEKGRISWTG